MTQESGNAPKPCGQCGRPVEGEALFCPHCGDRTASRLFSFDALPAKAPATVEKKPIVILGATFVEPPKLEVERRAPVRKSSAGDAALHRPHLTLDAAPPPSSSPPSSSLPRRIVSALGLLVSAGLVIGLVRALLPEKKETHLIIDAGAGAAPVAEGPTVNADGEVTAMPAGHGTLTPEQAVAEVERLTGAGSIERLQQRAVNQAGAPAPSASPPSSSPPIDDERRTSATALAEAGQTHAALAAFGDASVGDAASAHAVLTLSARAGRCPAAKEAAGVLAAHGDIAGGIVWMRTQVLCQGRSADAEALARALLSLPTTTRPQQAQLWGTLALVRLWSGDLGGAREASREVKTLDPDATPTQRVAARCAWAGGNLGALAAVPSPRRGIDADATLDAALDWVQHKTPPHALSSSSPWHKGAAMLRAVVALKKGGPKAAVDEARAALLAPRWDGSEEFPPSALELLDIATLAPPSQQPFAAALAHALAGDVDGLAGAGPWQPVLAAAVAHASHRADPSLLPPAPDSVLSRYLLRAADDAEPVEAIASFRPLLADPQLGLHAAFQIVVRNGVVDDKLIARIRKAQPGNPALVQLDAALATARESAAAITP